MLEAQVEEDRVVTGARSDADRERDARHDLQPARKIVSPADPGTDRQGVARGGVAGARHGLVPRPHDLEQGIEGGPRQPYDAGAEVVGDRRRLVTHGVLGRGCDGTAHIPVCDTLLATMTLAGTFTWTPSAPAPRSDRARAGGRSGDNRGATEKRSAAAS